MAIDIKQTAAFSVWIAGLRDQHAKATILRRVDRLRRCDFGDRKSVGDGVCELRINKGRGYRVYYVQRGDVCIILLCGGDKGSQNRDIKRAKALAKEL